MDKEKKVDQVEQQLKAIEARQEELKKQLEELKELRTTSQSHRARLESIGVQASSCLRYVAEQLKKTGKLSEEALQDPDLR